MTVDTKLKVRPKAMTFEEYQDAVRASERFWCESDFYWRANRWEPTLETRIATSVEPSRR